MQLEADNFCEEVHGWDTWMGGRASFSSGGGTRGWTRSSFSSGGGGYSDVLHRKEGL